MLDRGSVPTCSWRASQRRRKNPATRKQIHYKPAPLRSKCNTLSHYNQFRLQQVKISSAEIIRKHPYFKPVSFKLQSNSAGIILVTSTFNPIIPITNKIINIKASTTTIVLLTGTFLRATNSCLWSNS